MPSPVRTYDRRAVHAWAFYDFASSAYTTLVVTFIYSTYFTKAIAADETTGTSQWSVAVSLTAIVIALISPFIGAIADRGGYRKRFLLLSSITCIAATVVLFFPGQGEVAFALATFLVANVAFELSYVFYNAFLPDISPPERVGWVSGYGWGLGYIGGLLCLVAALVVFVLPGAPLAGLPDGANVRATNLLVAVWYALFSIPIFLFVRERVVAPERARGGVVRAAARQLVSTFHDIRRYRQIVRLLLARLVYNDGLVTIFAFGGIYAQGTFGFSTQDIILFGIVINLAAGLGALGFGRIDDRLGGKRTILITLAGLFVAATIAVVAEGRAAFWAAALLIGLMVGPNQSASRSLLARFVPADKETEFFGFFEFSGKATAFLGPAMLGWLTSVFQSQRAGVATVLVFFLLGALLLLRVDEAEGKAMARLEPGAPRIE